ncbi:MAG: hypothetical protein RLZZ175_2463 [Bacteroidota bacterium]
MKNNIYIARTVHGLESVLATELQNIGAQNIVPLRRAVQFEGDLKLLYKANYLLRTCLNILSPVATGTIKNEYDLYDLVKSVDWSKHLTLDTTFAIDSTVHSEAFNHDNYVALKSKDAIVDQFRERTGVRPSVDARDPDLRIHIHIDREKCNILLDSTGDFLYKRGYKLKSLDAPVNEVLAAGMLLLAGWDGQSDFVDGMCGSGTVPIEAALIATNTPSQSFREHFAFMLWDNYDRNLWLEVKEEAKKEVRNFDYTIWASDMDIEAVQITNMNAESAGVHDIIKAKCANFEDIQAPNERGGLLVMNPPYGERLGEKEEVNTLYSLIGNTFKHKFKGYKCWIISSNMEALKNVGLRPDKKIVLFNGALECKFSMYNIYEGSKKASKQLGS